MVGHRIKKFMKTIIITALIGLAVGTVIAGYTSGKAGA